MSNKEKCPECGSFQICTERRPNGKKWCTECNHVIERGNPLDVPILKNHDPSKSLGHFELGGKKDA
jgi:transcription initiation factor TFIIIB Brf1 subunit/transcription initiation factor TFIIB